MHILWFNVVFYLIGSSVCVFVCIVVLDYTHLSGRPYLPFSPFIFSVLSVYVTSSPPFSWFLQTEPRFTKFACPVMIRSHECSDWKELRVFLTVVVTWDVTPHSFAGRHRRFRETCLRLKRSKWLHVPEDCSRRFDSTDAYWHIWSSKGNRVWKPTSPLSA
jgi:hypothetical protein